MIRIVFTADNHLNKYYAKMTADQLARRRQRIREAWAQTVDFAIEKRAHFYLHGGDLFDTPNPRTSELVWVARQLQRLQDAGVTIYAIGGNHDVPKMRIEGATPHRIYDEVRVAHVFTRTTEVEWATHEIDGTTIAIGGLAPDPRLGRDDDPLEGVAIDPPEADVVLLLMHYAVEGTLYYEANEPLLSKAAIAGLQGIDYLLVGHVHQKHQLEIGGVTACFPGPTERMSFGELEAPTGFLFMKFDGHRPVRASIRRRRVDPQPMQRIEIRTTDLPPDDPTGYVFERVRAASHADQLLQCRLEGPLSREVYHRLRFFDIWRLGNELNFYFDLDRRGTYLQEQADLDVGFSTQRVSPRQEIEAVAEALAAEAEDVEERELIEEAKELALGRYRGEVGVI
ncbi:MAG: exonuclease SbcCD subunit D [Anaerolineae bacterium]